MQDYHCEWRTTLQAESPEAAAKAAVRCFAQCVHANAYHVMTVVTDQGDETDVPLEGLSLAEDDLFALDPEPRPILLWSLLAMACVLLLLAGAMFAHRQKTISAWTMVKPGEPGQCLRTPPSINERPYWGKCE